MLSYVGTLAIAHDDGRDLFELKPEEVQHLVTLVGDHYDRPAVGASNLLCAAYNTCRVPHTGGAPATKSARRFAHSTTPHVPDSKLSIQPNPTNNWAAFTYRLSGNVNTLQLRIRDAQGLMTHTLQASCAEGQVVWDTRGVAPGVYTVELLLEGAVQRTERLVIQPN